MGKFPGASRDTGKVALTKTTSQLEPTILEWLLTVLDEELEASGGALSWQRLRRRLLERHDEDPRARGRLADCRQLAGWRVLASIPESYLSREDRFVRLPPGTKKRKKQAELESRAQEATAVPTTTAITTTRTTATAVPTFLSLRVIPCGDESSFKEELRAAAARKRPRLVVVDFSAENCGPCQQLKPELHQLAAEMPEVAFLEVDVNRNEVVADTFGIKSVPTFLFFKGEKLLGSYEGCDVDELTMNVLQHK
ncbi:unnamed protein product [Polarella glacialis]|uniref:Thioredoxin domain-containing protein n=1 Tax=Polarella glacialis TaxID=89957 RepID=A0A813LTS3_POLGL|nr:unnamed protein product [Polarella glacialis]